MKLRTPAVLMYHGLADGASERDPLGLCVTSGMFERQMRWLVRRGWHALDLDAYLASRFGSRSGRRTVLLTFDDGYQSTLELAFPLLRELGLPGLLFVPPGALGGTAQWWHAMPDAPLIDADQLRTLAGLGIEVGAHGMEHVFMPGLSDRELHRNTREARDALADLLGKPPRAFAYPQGHFDRRVAAAVKQAGFTVAFSVKLEGGRFGVPRIGISPSDDLQTFRVKLLPAYHAWGRALERHPRVRGSIRKLARLAPLVENYEPSAGQE
jgi:peptidoglycan/xylan/chitin deacetylase (PgdA/CDA1 family)